MRLRPVPLAALCLGLLACSDAGPQFDEPGVLPEVLAPGLLDWLYQTPVPIADELARCPFDPDSGIMVCPSILPGWVARGESCPAGGRIWGFLEGPYNGVMDWEIWFDDCVVSLTTLDQDVESVDSVGFDLAFLVTRPKDIDPVGKDSVEDTLRERGLVGTWTGMGSLQLCRSGQFPCGGMYSWAFSGTLHWELRRLRAGGGFDSVPFNEGDCDVAMTESFRLTPDLPNFIRLGVEREVCGWYVTEENDLRRR